jgi:hypothetical protein
MQIVWVSRIDFNIQSLPTQTKKLVSVGRLGDFGRDCDFVVKAHNLSRLVLQKCDRVDRWHLWLI